MRTYELLRDAWWPHPAHESIEVLRARGLLVFRCSCGEQLGLPLSTARDLGVL